MADAADGQALRYEGRLDATVASREWTRATRQAAAARGQPFHVDLSAVSYCDLTGATFLAAIDRAHGGDVAFDGASDRVRSVLARASGAGEPPAKETVAPRTLAAILTAGIGAALSGVAFLGELAVAIAAAPSRLKLLRTRDLLEQMDAAGVRAVPLLVLLGFLIGLILAFQSAIPLKQFGADLYVANLVGLSMTRELGPLLASVILSGRTGSANAAELGTMKVNDEISALRVMGIDPMTLLVLPRLAASVLMMPAMTMVLNLAALAGMLVVMGVFGYPVVAVGHQLKIAVHARDIFGGLFKSLVFGAAVVAVGCRAGLATGTGPRAVGESATAAVVGGIVVTVMLDGLFAVLFYRLGL